jgi:TetR/AcrR family transcriptional regulator, transcriptional repressor for nem operon
VIESPKTARGRAARDRIIQAASELIGERGVAETSLDDVIDRAGASKSQLYHYFEDRAALLRAVVVHNTEAVLRDLGPVDNWKAIRGWFDSMVELQVECHARAGCPIGSLVPQLAEADERARLMLAASFTRWEAHLRQGLVSMPAIQGGLLLTQTRRDPGQLAIALDAAYAQLRARAPGARQVS